MGKPVSVAMSSFEYVRNGFPDPIRLMVNPSEITPEEWVMLIEDELEAVRLFLRDMLGFRPLAQVLKMDLEPIVGDIGGYDCTVDQNVICRLMWDRMPIQPDGRRGLFLLSRNGTWLLWSSEKTSADFGEKRRAKNASLRHINADQLLGILTQDRAVTNLLGFNLLNSVVKMVDETIEDRRERLESLRVYRRNRIGQSLSRINYWK